MAFESYKQIDETTYQCLVCGTKKVVIVGSEPDDCLQCDAVIRRRTTEAAAQAGAREEPDTNSDSEPAGESSPE